MNLPVPPPAWFPTWWLDFWGWLSREHAVLIVLATVGAVLVATWYAVLTRRLARQAKQQAIETRRQADITQQMFEASYRPYVRVSRSQPATFRSDDIFSFAFDLKLSGTVPAVLSKWELRVFPIAEDDALVDSLLVRSSREGWRRTLYPGEDTQILQTRAGQPGARPPPEPRVRVVFTVTYRGSTKTEYMTQFTMAGRDGEGWRLIDYDWR